MNFKKHHSYSNSSALLRTSRRTFFLYPESGRESDLNRVPWTTWMINWKLTSEVSPDLLGSIYVSRTVRIGFIGGEQGYNTDELGQIWGVMERKAFKEDDVRLTRLCAQASIVRLHPRSHTDRPLGHAVHSVWSDQEAWKEIFEYVQGWRHRQHHQDKLQVHIIRFNTDSIGLMEILTVGMPHRRDESHLWRQQWELRWERQPGLEESSFTIAFISSKCITKHASDVTYYIVSAGLQTWDQSSITPGEKWRGTRSPKPPIHTDYHHQRALRVKKLISHSKSGSFRGYDHLLRTPRLAVWWAPEAGVGGEE